MINAIYTDPIKYNQYQEETRQLFNKKNNTKEEFLKEWEKIETDKEVEQAFKFYQENNTKELKTDNNKNTTESLHYCLNALKLTKETTKILQILSPIKDIRETTINNLPEEHKTLILTIIYKIGNKIKKTNDNNLTLNLEMMQI